MNNYPQNPYGSNQSNYQPPQKPLPHVRFAAWYKRMWAKSRIITLVVTIVVLLLSCGVLSSISNASQNNSVTAGQATPTPKPTTLSLHNRVQTQVAEIPTPTPVPQPTPSSQAQVDQFVTSNLLGEATVSSYDQNTGVLVIEEDYGYKVALSQNGAKEAVKSVQNSLWKSGLHFSSVTVNIMQYQPDENRTLKKVAYGTLGYQTASKINFTFTLDLWTKLDEKWVDPNLPNY